MGIQPQEKWGDAYLDTFPKRVGLSQEDFNSKLIFKDLPSRLCRWKDWHFPHFLFPVGVVVLKVSGWDLSHLPGAQTFKADSQDSLGGLPAPMEAGDVRVGHGHGWGLGGLCLPVFSHPGCSH